MTESIEAKAYLADQPEHKGWIDLAFGESRGPQDEPPGWYKSILDKHIAFVNGRATCRGMIDVEGVLAMLHEAKAGFPSSDDPTDSVASAPDYYVSVVLEQNPRLRLEDIRAAILFEKHPIEDPTLTRQSTIVDGKFGVLVTGDPAIRLEGYEPVINIAATGYITPQEQEKWAPAPEGTSYPLVCYYECSDEKLMEAVARLNIENADKIAIKRDPNSAMSHEQLVAFEERFSMVVRDFLTAKDMHGIVQPNIIANMPRVWEGKRRGGVAYVIGAGPSVDMLDVYKWLTENTNPSDYVFVTDAAWQSFNTMASAHRDDRARDAGSFAAYMRSPDQLIPNLFGITLEPRPVKLDAFNGHPRPEVWSHIIAHKVRLANANVVGWCRAIDEWNGDVGIPRSTPTFQHMGHITAMGGWLGAWHDCHTVVLIGCDYALKDGARYCDGSPNEEPERVEVEIEAFGGGKAITLNNYLQDSREMEMVGDRLRQMGIRTINATNVGCALLDGWEHCTIRPVDGLPTLNSLLRKASMK